MNIFARITKVDAAKREVWGIAAQEVADKSGEIFDYDSSVPYFKNWSSEFEKNTDGKSLGNIRAMHGKVAAGKAIAINFNDAEKSIEIGAHIVDDGEWNKVEQGVYTGFSIGGSYEKRWQDGTLKRYTAKPSEISIVDNPCIPTATFQMIKADGVIEERNFVQKVDADPAIDEIADMLNKGEITAADLLELAKKKKSGKDGDGKYGDVKYADTKNKKYPIDTEKHIRAAWSYINQEKDAKEYSASELKTIKDNIIAAWKETIDKDGPPSADKSVMPILRKGMYGVAQFAQLLQNIDYLLQDTKWEAEIENDNSPLPGQILAWLKTGAELLNQMVIEETTELTADPNYPIDPIIVEAAAKLGELAKRGARNSKGDQEKIQTVHDHSVALGATCEAEKSAQATLQKHVALHDELTKTLEAAGFGKEGDEIVPLIKNLIEQHAEISKKYEDILGQPAPGKGLLNRIGVLNKSQDTFTDDSGVTDSDPTVRKADGSIDNEATALNLIKQSHQNPILVKTR